MSDRLPILRIGGNLVVSIQPGPDDQTELDLQEDLAAHVVGHGARGVIVIGERAR